MRIMSVIGALALACLCLASPSIAASPTDHLSFDVVGHELLVTPTSLEFAVTTDVSDAMAPPIILAVPIVADLPGAGDGDEPALCPATAPLMLDAFGNPLRDDDVGWCPT